MRIDKTRHHHTTARIDHFAVSANQRLDRFVRPNPRDPLPHHQQRAVCGKGQLTHFRANPRTSRPGKSDDLRAVNNR